MRGLLVGAAAALALAAPASAATLRVDDDGVQCPGAAFQSIQAAVDAAAAHDTVAVCDGTYTEAVRVDRDGLQLKAAGPAVTLRLPGGGSASGVTVTGSGVQVRGLTITGACEATDEDPEPQCAGVDVEPGGSTRLVADRIAGIRVDGFSEDAGYAAGVLVEPGGALRMLRSTLVAFQDTGVDAYGPITLRDDTFDGGFAMGEHNRQDGVVEREVVPVEVVGNRFTRLTQIGRGGSNSSAMELQYAPGSVVSRNAVDAAGLALLLYGSGGRVTRNTLVATGIGNPFYPDDPYPDTLGIALARQFPLAFPHGNFIAHNRVTVPTDEAIEACGPLYASPGDLRLAHRNTWVDDVETGAADPDPFCTPAG